MTAVNTNDSRNAEQPDELVVAELVPQPQPDPGERITILRLMAWTAGSAVIMGLHRQLSALPDDPDTSVQWLRTLGTITSSIFQGAGIASLALVIWRRFYKGPQFPRQPGHWLLVISGIYTVASTFGYLALYETFRQEPWTYITYYRLPLLGLMTLLITVALIQMPFRVDWLLVCLAWLASFFVMIVVACGRLDPDLSPAAVMLEAFITLVANALFVIPVLVDYSLNVKRDQLHFAGIAVRLGLAALQVIAILKELSKLNEA
jgi:hypothetical protein